MIVFSTQLFFPRCVCHSDTVTDIDSKQKEGNMYMGILKGEKTSCDNAAVSFSTAFTVKVMRKHF